MAFNSTDIQQLNDNIIQALSAGGGGGGGGDATAANQVQQTTLLNQIDRKINSTGEFSVPEESVFKLKSGDSVFKNEEDDLSFLQLIEQYTKNIQEKFKKPSDLLVTGTAVTGASVTVTLPAVLNKFHYITSIEIVKYSGVNITGSPIPIIVSTTNLFGQTFMRSRAAAAGTVEKDYIIYNSLKSQAANTPTTIVCPAVGNVIWQVSVNYYVQE